MGLDVNFSPGTLSAMVRYAVFTLRSVLIEVGPSESHELLNSFWVGSSGSGDPHGVQGSRCGGLGR